MCILKHGQKKIGRVAQFEKSYSYGSPFIRDKQEGLDMQVGTHSGQAICTERCSSFSPIDKTYLGILLSHQPMGSNYVYTTILPMEDPCQGVDYVSKLLCQLRFRHFCICRSDTIQLGVYWMEWIANISCEKARWNHDCVHNHSCTCTTIRYRHGHIYYTYRDSKLQECIYRSSI